MLTAISGFLSGAVGAMGMGGGGVLLLYLTLFAHMNQRTAGGINLLFFIPCAVTALILHGKNSRVEWKIALPLAVLGLFGAYIGTELHEMISENILRKIFAAMLLCIGITEIFAKGSKNEAQKDTQ